MLMVFFFPILSSLNLPNSSFTLTHSWHERGQIWPLVPDLFHWHLAIAWALPVAKLQFSFPFFILFYLKDMTKVLYKCNFVQISFKPMMLPMHFSITFFQTLSALWKTLPKVICISPKVFAKGSPKRTLCHSSPLYHWDLKFPGYDSTVHSIKICQKLGRHNSSNFNQPVQSVQSSVLSIRGWQGNAWNWLEAGPECFEDLTRFQLENPIVSS